MKKTKFLFIAFFILIAVSYRLQAQMITGVWQGKINKQKVEIKIIQKGDNLDGTSYYYESTGKYRRYSIKGYFDTNTNEAVWWDDELLEENTGRLTSPGKVPLLSRADFNCPGDGKMMLDGIALRVDNENQKAGDVHLDKTNDPEFSDEWDFVIENYTIGANNPDIIDSIGSLLSKKHVEEPATPANLLGNADTVETAPKILDLPVTKIDLPVRENKISIPSPTLQTIEEKFSNRKKIFATEIPVSGDSIELRFYDNAQIDGDSISLFLNDKLIFEHIRLTEKAYTVKLPVSALNASNELIMVAENLGSIPPNTSYMVALVEEKRYEARLESTEGSSAMIRLIRK